MNRFWPELGRWYGANEIKGPELDEGKFTVIDPGDVPTPLGYVCRAFPSHLCPRGFSCLLQKAPNDNSIRYGPPAKAAFLFTLTGWAAEPENHEAWKAIMAQHNLTHNPFEDVEAHFTFGDAAAWGLAMALSMNKARYFGFSGFVDTTESVYKAYDEMNKLSMLPPMVVKDPRPGL